MEHTTAGAKKAGRDVGDLDIGAWLAFTVGPDSAEAKRAAGSLVVFYVSAMPREQIERHGIDFDSLARS